MTRETRIGLLVGLGFIVMFGVVLGELTGTSRPERESGTMAGRGVDQDWSPIVEDVPVGAIDTVPLAAARDEAASEPPGAGEGAVVELTLIALDESAPGAAVVSEMHWRPPMVVRPAAPRTYTVQADDSLRKIARKVYGTGREGLYRKIFQANRNILDDESMVLVGQELVIPPLPSQDARPQLPAVRQATEQPPRTASASDPRPQYREMDLRELRSHFASGSPRRPRTSGRIYVVREGDNLSRIAREMLNDGSRNAVKRIYDANRDRLSSPDLLPVGTKLRIPS